MNEYTLNAVERQMVDDLDWAETAPEVQRHSGMLVVVHRKRVVAVGSDRDTIVAKAAAEERCAREDLVVVAVPRDDLSEIPH
jgi:hypothetical protein